MIISDEEASILAKKLRDHARMYAHDNAINFTNPIEEMFPGEAKVLYTEALANFISCLSLSDDEVFKEKLRKIMVDISNLGYGYDMFL